MSSPLQIACPHCHAFNRVPGERLGDAPNCGRCGKARAQRCECAIVAGRHVRALTRREDNETRGALQFADARDQFSAVHHIHVARLVLQKQTRFAINHRTMRDEI